MFSFSLLRLIFNLGDWVWVGHWHIDISRDLRRSILVTSALALLDLGETTAFLIFMERGVYTERDWLCGLVVETRPGFTTSANPS